MLPNSYTLIDDLSETADTELRPISSIRKKPSSSKVEVVALGKPHTKPSFDTFDLVAVFSSLACLVISVCVVAPSVGLSWRLRFEGQIVVIGLLMSIMGLCLRRIAPTLLLILEARWGSRLQSYDAILRNTAVLSQTSLLWRGIILFFVILPLALSAAYKKFTNGLSSIAMPSEPPGLYGAKAPLSDFNNLTTNSIHLMMDATLPFMRASSDDTILPPSKGLFPKAYGYNTLLLNTTSAAMLDIPMPDYIESIRQQLAPNSSESWTVSASVNATVTRYNTSGKSYIDDDVLWEGGFGAVGHGLVAYQLFNGYTLGFLLGQVSKSEGTYCFLGTYKEITGTDWLTTTRDPHDDDSVAFRSAALMFNTRRERCKGTWQITNSNITLIGGYCTGVPTTQDILDDQPFAMDAMPVLVHILERYAGVRKESPWLLPTFVVSVANMYWARMVYIKSQLPTYSREISQEIYYNATDETIVSTRSTLNAHWLLYVVLALQPFLAIVMFLSATLFFSTPIDKGFGIVAILAGIDRESLDLLHGASLSGELRKPVRLDIAISQDEVDDQAQAKRRIVYTLGRERHSGVPLERGKKYD
ncbi:MAG: hypothetical protein M1812_004542 [Candelaria pacifica]|nr:MAG: hypothetical protein M1812_004542 [Candelaria pacifica]